MPDRTINLDPIPRGNGSRENHGRPTMAWFFRPPSVDPSGIRLTGLPEDCFYWADAWQEHQVSVQTRKTFETVDGRTEPVILVMDIDRHAGLHNGAPIVAMQQFGFGPGGAPNEDSARRWGRICKMLNEVKDAEVEVEETLLKNIEDDLGEAIGDPNYRRGLRERRNILRARLERLKAGIDFDTLKQFFVDEAIRSQEPLKRRDAAQEAYFRKIAEEVVDRSGMAVTA